MMILMVTIGIDEGTFLGYVVTQNGEEINSTLLNKYRESNYHGVITVK